MHSLKNGTKCWGEISHENPPLTYTDPKKTVKKKRKIIKKCVTTLKTELGVNFKMVKYNRTLGEILVRDDCTLTSMFGAVLE